MCPASAHLWLVPAETREDQQQQNVASYRLQLEGQQAPSCRKASVQVRSCVLKAGGVRYRPKTDALVDVAGCQSGEFNVPCTGMLKDVSVENQLTRLGTTQQPSQASADGVLSAELWTLLKRDSALQVPPCPRFISLGLPVMVVPRVVAALIVASCILHVVYASFEVELAGLKVGCFRTDDACTSNSETGPCLLTQHAA